MQNVFPLKDAVQLTLVWTRHTHITNTSDCSLYSELSRWCMMVFLHLSRGGSLSALTVPPAEGAVDVPATKRHSNSIAGTLGFLTRRLAR